MEDKIAGVQVYGPHVLKQQRIVGIERDQGVAALLGISYVSKGRNIAELPDVTPSQDQVVRHVSN